MSDVILDQGNQVTVLCTNLNVQGHDLILDGAARRTPGGSQFRRALVHEPGDSLTVNFAGDYPGGLKLNGVAEIRPLGGDLLVHGGITYEVPGLDIQGNSVPARVSVEALFNTILGRVAELEAKVAELEARL